MEVVTWAQLRMHSKPCILVNSTGYWNGLLSFLQTAVTSGFVKPVNFALLRVAQSPEEAVAIASAAMAAAR